MYHCELSLEIKQKSTENIFINILIILIIEKHDKSDNRKADLFDSMKIYKHGCLGANIKEAGKEK